MAPESKSALVGRFSLTLTSVAVTARHFAVRNKKGTPDHRGFSISSLAAT
jgi:hypothetical protein